MATSPSSRHVLVFPILAPLAVVAACSSGNTIDIANYDTSCTAASDCVAVIVGDIECCSDVNAAISKAQLARYQADFADAERHRGVCNASCGTTPDTDVVCSKGTCGLIAAGAVACNGATCGAGEVCVKNQAEGGAQILPDDAGACPQGDTLEDGICQPLPIFRCASRPAACAPQLSCGCAQTLCDIGFTCQQASAGLVACSQMAP